MCAACGFPAAPGHWTEAGASTAPDRLRARFRRAQVLNALLRPHHLSVHDDGLTPGLQLRTPTGATTIVADLTTLWAEVVRLTGQPLDPLATTDA